MAQQHFTAPSRTEIDYYVKLAKAERNQYIADKATALAAKVKVALRSLFQVTVSKFQVTVSKQSPSH
ncbi:hypothetical protein EHN06_02480 [Marinobacter sp. NP-4(2019)]|uniref:RSP_7527 family protein n=1 Tax=Marinobacter sp. NP-4(2019) TaxID=2488665 RepID=UPI000FC3E1A2|nr:hypothetical protein [Marinobacter sp. NP-4(2019)]AZT82498.1 hypothetical protein EHN06_02480 [Marinobacter sp. NP-4(2019)]